MNETVEVFAEPDFDSSTPKKPTFKSRLKNLVVSEGQPLELSVSVSGYPPPDVKWFRDQKDVIGSGRYIMSQDGNTHYLVIKEAALTDEAEYTAVAQSKFGKVSSSAMVTVKQVEMRPVFDRKLEDAKIVSGFDVVLSAKIKGHPEPKADFYHNNKLLFSSEKYTISVDKTTGDCSLKIAKCDVKDHGQYKCTIRNKLGQATCFAKLNVSAPVLSPQFTLGLTDTECMEGKDVVLKVEFTGKPKPVISWYRNGDVLKQFGRFRTKTDATISTLSLNRAKLDESCDIKCVACNEGGEAETSCKLNIIEDLKKPEFIYSPKNLKIYENGSGSLRATFSGKPAPEANWYKDGELISNSKNFEVQNDGLKTSLNIRGCTGAMAGMYTCTATNKAGDVSCNVAVIVEEALYRPEFVQVLKDTRCKEGESVTLEVETKGNPRPTVQWFKNEKLIVSSNDVILESEDDRHRLLIPSCSSAHIGPYKVIAKNKMGECSSRGKLSVDQSAQKPSFSKKLDDIDLFDSDTAFLEVEATGKPTPRLTWYHDSNEVQLSKRCRLEKSENRQTLVISDICTKDEGTYECIAENLAGRTSCMCFLKIKEPLFAPEFAVPPENTTIDVGDNSTVYFVVVSNPRAEVSVLKDGDTVSNNVKLMMDGVTGEGRINISSFNEDDSGVYRIVASNSQGQSECEFIIECPGAENSSPIFNKPLSDVQGKIGDTAVLSVEFGGNVLDVDWYKDDQYITDSNKYEIIDEEFRCTLAIHDCQEEDEGVYRCEIGNDDAHSSSEARLIIEPAKRRLSARQVVAETVSKQEVVVVETAPLAAKADVQQGRNLKPELEMKPEFLTALEDSNYFVGDNVTLQVKVQGTPIPEVTWFKGAQQVRKSARILTRKDSNQVRTLIIRDASINDSGEYKCVATNQHGSVFSKAKMLVTKPLIMPKFLKAPTDVTFTEGNKIVIEFSVSGNPSPSVKCNFKGENNNLKDVSNLIKPGVLSKLIIPNGRVENSGVYEFVAENEAGQATCQANVKVKTEEKKPVFTRQLSDAKVEIGNTLKLTTTCKGIRKEEVTWKKDDKVIDKIDKRIIQNVQEDVLSLTISKFEASDAGMYSCSVENNVGSDVTKCTVLVQQGISRPVFTKKLKDVTVEEGSKIELLVEVEGHPEPTVKWTKDNMVVRDGGRIKIEKSEGRCKLTIDNANKNDKGTYCCCAKNSNAEVKTSCVVFISKNLKGKPTFMNAKAAFENKVDGDKNVPFQSKKQTVPQKIGKSISDSRSVFGDQRAKFEKKPDHAQAVEQKVELKAESKAEPKIEPRVEPKVESKVESKIEPKVEARVERQVDSKIKSKFESKIEPKIEPKTEQKFEPKIGRKVDSKIKSKFESKIEPKIEPKMESKVEHKVELKSEPKVETKVEPNVERKMEQKIERRIFERVDSKTSDFSQPSSRRSSTSSTSSSTPRGVGAPVFVKPLESLIYVEGLSKTLSVVVKGNPEPELQWLHNGRLLTKGRSFDIEKGFRGDHRLKVKGFNASLAGTYTAVAINELGKVECTTKLEPKGKEEAKKQISDVAVETKIKPSNEPKSTSKEIPSEGSSTLFFVKELENVEICEGKEAMLEVVVDGELPVNCKWEKDGRPVRNTLSTRFDKKDNVCFLKIGRPTKMESGKYSAVVSNSKDTITSTCDVKVLPAPVKPSFLLKLRDVNIFEGKDMEVSAKVNGKPDPDVKWYLNGEEVETGGRYNIVKRPDGRQIFKMAKISVDDGGELKCEATNSGGTAVCTSKISVRGSSRPASASVSLPGFTKQLEDQTFVEGEVMELKTETTGSLTVVWYKDGKQILKSSRLQMVSVENQHTLKILKAHPQDCGTYKAVAKNRAGEKSCTAKVDVRKSLTAPVVKRGLDMVSVNEGEAARFRARFEGVSLSVEWQKDGVLVKPEGNITMSETQSEFELQIKNTKRDDCGKYECVAKNAAGEVSSAAELVVKEVEIPPKFVRKMKDVNMDEGGHLELTVEVAGTPKPEVEFSKDGKNVNSGEVTEVKVGTWKLEIKATSLSDSGVYTCKAWNKISTVTCSSNINVKRSRTAPSFSTLLDETNEVVEKEELRLEVVAAGHPPPDIEWFKRGRKLFSTENMKITKGESNSLVLCHARMEDAGEYKCVARNSLGKCEQTFSIVIKGICFVFTLFTYDIKLFLKRCIYDLCMIQNLFSNNNVLECRHFVPSLGS